MHPFSILTLGIFVAGYITARWDLVTRLYELAIFAAEYGVVVCYKCSAEEELPTIVCHWLTRLGFDLQIRAAKGVVALTALFLTIFIPVVWVARKETFLV